ncbi:hypothetical protein EV209_1364 [Cuneatibacter caecimuris]|uniref:Uncharacterized protein n=1 Tax=Cuneatibacter caecimuris TaxID=1796618 RepID=A0A4Q7PLC3_9FIRM|nr:hypothetical protein EV209_1364 [Cuneatibacter caecimuris]
MNFYIWLMRKGLHHTYSDCRKAYRKLSPEIRLELWAEYNLEQGES